MIEYLWLALYFIIGLILFGMIFLGLVFGAMYTRIPTKKLKKIIELCNLRFDMIVYDLGAGLGTFSFEAAYSGAKIIAVEIDPIKVALMKFLLRYNNNMAKASYANPVIGSMTTKVKHLDVEIKQQNIFKTELGDADLVYCYLSPVLMPKIAEKANKEMKKGSRIISVEHPIKTWIPTYSDGYEKIYVYTIGISNEVTI